MSLKLNILFRFSLSFLLLLSINVYGQIVGSTDFEQFSKGSYFTKADWQSAGFTVPWVNGFDVNRAIIDDAFSKSGSNALRLFYPKGQFGTANTGGQAPLMVPPHDEYFISYYVRFSDDFSWGTSSEGGKLPGLAGGDRCSGCATCTGSNGFTARLMWRAEGKAVIYLYHLNKVSPPCGDNYDIVIDGKTLNFEKGQWYKISQRVKVNSGVNKDGEVEMWINDKHAQIRLYNGALVDKLSGIQFVSNGDKVDALYFSTFHGGSTADWAPLVDSYIWFDDIVISTSLSDVVNGTVTSNMQSNTSIDKLEIFPVPVKQNEIVYIPEVIGNTSIEWIDMMGKVLTSSAVQNGGIVVAPSINKGVYLIRYASQNEIFVKRIMVE
ncbi:MAG: T9SS type A sorting domain-containing protein [Sporocytophaga sp.]|uniref:T9SS type A sorting domain-containing protein n=1 Tax=Sporocytophaga sp. TaxID=2231183 RepID=UPI001B27D082|nr:T9SS type A sorting domain-containing protein [Sporocytophaga sp.]MBO9700099.1 T9SS type A sorting domain-containing protein [Sporocytophaga sp.]